MKRTLSLLLALTLLYALLTACGIQPSGSTSNGEDIAFVRESMALRCRVVSVNEDGTMLLAGMDTGNPDIYTLDTDELTADVQLAVGDLVEVRCDSILETYPARFAEVDGLTVLPDEFNDRCALYRRVLDDLWDRDEGLNDGLELISVDLTATALSPAERSAVAWSFAQSHGISMPLELNSEQLAEQGYLSGLEGENPFPAWENGILFTITETDEPVTFNLPSLSKGEEIPPMAEYNVKDTVCFDASKWRSALGAYGFSQCVAVQGCDGVWGDYTINGEEWIS